MHLVICLLIFVGSTLSEEADYIIDNPNRLECGIQQKGFHVKLQCDIHGIAKGQPADCILRLHLPQGFFLDPYEFSSRYPAINFTLSKIATDPDKSGFGKWFSWFMGSDYPKRNEIQINQSDVDVEAPEWLAESMNVYLHTNQMPRNTKDSQDLHQIEIPLHLRYHLPSEDNSELSVTSTSLPHPSLTCSDGYSFNNLDHKDPFAMDVVVPHRNDLIYVMPLTILFLTVGVVVLLLA